MPSTKQLLFLAIAASTVLAAPMQMKKTEATINTDLTMTEAPSAASAPISGDGVVPPSPAKVVPPSAPTFSQRRKHDGAYRRQGRRGCVHKNCAHLTHRKKRMYKHSYQSLENGPASPTP
ncbi:hypothetical protein DACRYDRAFT_23053, partial [Dacryopinax primogenitus]